MLGVRVVCGDVATLGKEQVRWPWAAKPDWWASATCRLEGAPPEVFYPEKRGARRPDGSPAPAYTTADALAFCLRCPVRLDCLESGLYEKDGIFGGFTPSQRNRITRLMRQGSTLALAAAEMDRRRHLAKACRA